ncbi:spore germination protein [Ammoniphilus sp. CFH 90114]|uniref:spore germination protein n=1 Tax=Ammoniphilus sp. CFH 90114 TaxID=2493665 RepID=UPI00100E0708|nr:spore germination protein [Ammoniphilus sp. CFH 90114]RXT09127.1 spore germination protein [Ammoniphilus sp. CFH 90114]
MKDLTEFIKSSFHYPNNKDFKIREVFIPSLKRTAQLFFLETIVDSQELETAIIRPLTLDYSESRTLQSLITAKSIEIASDRKDALTKMVKGSVGLIVERDKNIYLLNVTKFPKRSIGKAESEIVLKGPKEAFTESASDNMGLIRKRILNENLVFENVTVGNISNNDAVIVYLSNVANANLIDSVKKRIKEIQSDGVINLEILEQYIEDNPKSLVATMAYTERPDRVASHIDQGYVAILMENSSSALLLPTTFWSFFHSVEDHYLRMPYGNYIRILRVIALLIAMLTSASYVAITNFHSEMIPPDLLLAIAGAREKVPFPIAVEVLIMEVAFELIREAGLRIPSAIGPTIGIVGALILGQAAVEANIVSPIIIIVVAISGLSSFLISDISFNFAVRIGRFGFILGAATFGFLGIMGVLVMGLSYLTTIKSFGVPFFAPMTPQYRSSGDTIFRRIVQNELFRPAFLKTKRPRRKG